MAGDRPRICAPIVNKNLDAVRNVDSLVDMYEVRIDLIGDGWEGVAGILYKPWIACNRLAREGGAWKGGSPKRIKTLLSAIDLGASIVDIELATPKIEKIVADIKGKAGCLISYHNLKETPPLEEMKEIVDKQLAAGADICKVVSTAQNITDNAVVLQLISEYRQTKLVSFAMGNAGQISRIICPLVGGYFTYASIEPGSESASGQVTAEELRKIYGMIGD